MENYSQRFLLIIGVLSISFPSVSQNVGINSTGATPNTSAGLDIDFTNKGLLIPRVALSARNSNAPIGAGITTGLMVYNTATSGAAPNNVIPGFYYWNGGSWISFGGTGGNDWSLTGNSGTTAGTNFTGTTDATDWVIKTNNTEQMRILSNGNVGIGTTGATQKLDVQGGNARINNAFIGDVGHGATWGGISHSSMNTTTGYALIESSDGAYTLINKQNTGTGYIGFRVANTDVAVITNAGRMGIGTTNPYTSDLFSSFGNAASPYAVNGYTSGGGAAVYGYRSAGTTGTWGALQGEVVSSAPNNSNGVSGLVNSTNHRGVTGQKPSGGLQWGGLFLNDLGYTGFFGSASDERFKKDIIKLENGLENLLKLKVYKYHYTEPELGGDHIFYYGFMAQEIEKVFPDMVQEKDFTPGRARSFDNGSEKDLKIKAVSTISLIPVLVKATQEQQELIEQQNKKIEALEKMVAEMKSAMEK
jgi:hypothetical protein